MRYWGLALASAFVGGVVAHDAAYKHVFYVSIDGFHGSDVEKYVTKRPDSTIAKLLSTGYEYTNAFTSAPSDSFPGTIAQATGAMPVTTGVWYDDVWDRAFFAPGSNCTEHPGAEGEFLFFKKSTTLRNGQCNTPKIATLTPLSSSPAASIPKISRVPLSMGNAQQYSPIPVFVLTRGWRSSRAKASRLLTPISILHTKS